MSKMDEVASGFVKRKEEYEERRKRERAESQKEQQEAIARLARFKSDIENLFPKLQEWLEPLRKTTGAVATLQPVAFRGKRNTTIHELVLRSNDFNLACMPGDLSRRGDYVASATIQSGTRTANLELRGDVWTIKWDFQNGPKDFLLSSDSLADFISSVYSGD